MRTLTFRAWDTSTRNCNTQHVTLFVRDADTWETVATVTGISRWYNRRWEKYDKHDALVNALKSLGASPESIEGVGKCSSLEQAVNWLDSNLRVKEGVAFVDYRD